MKRTICCKNCELLREHLRLAGKEKMKLKRQLSKVQKEEDNKIVIEESMLIWAFRYCLTRSSYAVGDCIMHLVRNWKKISKPTKELIKKEINKAIDENIITFLVDKNEWLNILVLED